MFPVFHGLDYCAAASVTWFLSARDILPAWRMARTHQQI